jgi:hypothetical protein
MGERSVPMTSQSGNSSAKSLTVSIAPSPGFRELVAYNAQFPVPVPISKTFLMPLSSGAW